MTEIHLDFLNLNYLFIILLVLLIGLYLYYEIHKIKLIINDIQYKLNQRENLIEEVVRPVNYKDEMIVPLKEDHVTSLTNEVDEWSHIHQQMNKEDDIESSSDSEDVSEDIKPENNSANIDEILAGKNIITDNSLSDILNVDSDLNKIDEFINTIKENELTKIISTDYDKMTVSQLKKILSDKELPVSGNKTKLIERIKETNDQ
tara:strand:- start:291 stop:902 length:612 start_codon:yes stop_codon:yes gene_type:complete